MDDELVERDGRCDLTGMSRPPARVMPSQALGSRQARASSSSRAGMTSRQPSGSSESAGAGADAATEEASLVAASRKATVRSCT